MERRSSLGKDKLAPIVAERQDPVLRSSYYEESDIHDDLDVKIILPTGAEEVFHVKNGETVSQIKRLLVTTRDSAKGLAFGDIQLFLNGKFMMDPLSLNDFPATVGKTEIIVELRLKDGAPPVASSATPLAPAPQGAASSAKIPGSVSSQFAASGSPRTQSPTPAPLAPASAASPGSQQPQQQRSEPESERPSSSRRSGRAASNSVAPPPPSNIGAQPSSSRKEKRRFKLCSIC